MLEMGKQVQTTTWADGVVAGFSDGIASDAEVLAEETNVRNRYV